MTIALGRDLPSLRELLASCQDFEVAVATAKREPSDPDPDLEPLVAMEINDVHSQIMFHTILADAAGPSVAIRFAALLLQLEALPDRCANYEFFWEGEPETIPSDHEDVEDSHAVALVAPLVGVAIAEATRQVVFVRPPRPEGTA